MIYLTLLMNAAVRALTFVLIAWLTAAASFPPCCWSMAAAHDHQARHHPSDAPAQPHAHHHASADSTSIVASSPALSASAAHDCDAETMEAVATPRSSRSSVDVRSADAAVAALVVTQGSAGRRERSDSAPPGGNPGSAFLNPLRI